MPHASQAAFLTHAATLRNATFDAEFEESGAVHSALFCDLDPEIGTSKLQIFSTPGIIGSIDAVIDGVPRWVVLRLELGDATFVPGDVLGLVVQGSADRPLSIKVFLRMVRDGSHVDTQFDDSVVLSGKTGVVTALHTLSAMDPGCGAPGQCALILGLPHETCRITLQDLGFFVLPAESGLRSKPLDFASFAA